MFTPTDLSGNPDLIESRARVYKNTAARLKRAADDLAELTDDATFVSLAVDEVRLKALDARSATERVSVRYDGAADALATYAHELRAAQNRARRAAEAFHGAAGQESAAQRAMDDARDEMQANAGQPELVQAFLAARSAFQSFAASTANAIAEYQAAVRDKDDAAARAAAGIGEAMASAGLQDNFFEAIGGRFQEAYEWAQVVLGPIIEELYEVLSSISEILNVIALIVTIAAVFLPALAPLAAALQTVALVLSVLVFACSAALFILGRASLGQMLSDGLSMAVNIFTAGAGGTAIKSALGAASPAVVAMQNPALTLGGQIVMLKVLGPTGIQLSTATAEGAMWVGEQILGETIELATDPIDPGRVDLAPSAAGPDWNPPPVADVPPVFTTTPDFAAIEIVPPAFEEYAAVTLEQPSCLVASA